MNKSSAHSHNSPWFWVPSTYIMEGIPGTIVFTLLAIMYKDLGVSNTAITLYVGALTLPYTLKPLWVAFIDACSTKRIWIYILEIIIGGLLIAFALALSFNHFFAYSLAIAWLISFSSSSHDMATDGFYIVALKPEQQAFFVGIRGAAYNIGKIFAIGGLTMIAGYLFELTGDRISSWQLTFGLAGIVCFFFGIWHCVSLPKDEKLKTQSFSEISNKFIEVFIEFFKLPNLKIGLLFLLFFSASETSLGLIAPLFLKDSIANGGLALSNETLGFIYGVLSPLCIVLVGIIGGYVIYKKGLKFWMWPMLLILNIGHVVYIFLAYTQPSNEYVIGFSICLEQALFAFGYAAYSMIMLYIVKDSKFKTAHFSYITASMMLSRMLFTMISGPIESALGYENFFIYILLLLIPAAIVVRYFKVDPEYAKK